MPFYQYSCKDCGKDFEVFSKTAGQMPSVSCRFCGSKNVEKRLSNFFVPGSRSSSSADSTGFGSCPGCCNGSCPMN